MQYYGKPYSSIYECAKKRFSPDSHFYMIGDSIEADIKGGNDNDCDSVLVLTGKGTRDDLKAMGAEFQPKYIYDNVLDAVTGLNHKE